MFAEFYARLRVSSAKGKSPASAEVRKESVWQPAGRGPSCLGRFPFNYRRRREQKAGSGTCRAGPSPSRVVVLLEEFLQPTDGNQISALHMAKFWNVDVIAMIVRNQPSHNLQVDKLDNLAVVNEGFLKAGSVEDLL